MFDFSWVSKRNITCGIFLLAGFGLTSGFAIADELSDMNELQKNAPKNWGKWGDDDQVGALNYLDDSQVSSFTESQKKFKFWLPFTMHLSFIKHSFSLCGVSTSFIMPIN